MKNTKNKKWFTLVELIIVITILAILATIAFISFQSYTAQSRDAKVQSELGGARNAIEAELAKNSSILLSLASNTWSNVGTLKLGWKTITKSNSNYKAWDLNTTLLWGVKFDNKYKVWVTNVIGDNYQLAWTLTDGWSKAYVIWNYNARWTWATDTASWTVDATNKKITLTSWLWLFKVGDIIKWSTSWTGEITKISSDLKDLTFSWTIAWTSFTLNAAESDWLISSSYNGASFVTNNWTVLPY